MIITSLSSIKWGSKLSREEEDHAISIKQLQSVTFCHYLLAYGQMHLLCPASVASVTLVVLGSHTLSIYGLKWPLVTQVQKSDHPPNWAKLWFWPHMAKGFRKLIISSFFSSFNLTIFCVRWGFIEIFLTKLVVTPCMSFVWNIFDFQVYT